MSGAIERSRLLRLGLATVIAMGATGCALRTMKKQLEQLERQLCVVQGRVAAEGWDGHPIVVVLSREAEPGEPHLVDFRMRYAPGPFLFVVQEGAFQLAAFEDRNGDLTYAPGDPAVALGDPTTFSLAGGEERTGVDLDGLSREVRLGERFHVGRESGRTQLNLLHQNLGTIVSLNDRRLSRKMGSKGLWEPRTYLLEVGAGVFFLEPYDPDKIPVLLVHGIAGSPVEFRYLIDSLDRDRYQPWLLAYPSAFPIAFLGGRLNDMLNLLHRRHGFERLHVIAHSMGGLVSRAFINEYVHEGRHDYLGQFVTLSTPWSGADFASYYEEQPSPLELMRLRSRSNVRQDLAAGELPRPLVETLGTPPPGLKKPHIAWVDMNPRSEFLRSVLSLPLPDGVDYYLAWGWDGGVPMSGGPGDGVIAQWSLLREEAQLQATQQYGGEWSHTGILEAEDAIERVLEWLERDGGDT